MFRSLATLLLVAGTAYAQIENLRAEIRSIYTPPDSKTNSDLVRARTFFGEVKDKPNVSEYIAALRAELEDRSNSARMRANGTAALLFLSDSDENRLFAARMLARVNFQEVGMVLYYGVARPLASKNVDVSLAAFRLLERPDVRMNWVSDFSFDQAELVASLLIPIDEKYWANQAIERLASEQDETAQKTLLRLVWHVQSDFADAELAKFAKDAKKPLSSRALAQELLSKEPNLSVLDRTEVLASTEDQLHEDRRRRQSVQYFKNIMPLIERDTMKILLKRRLAASKGAN